MSDNTGFTICVAMVIAFMIVVIYRTSTRLETEYAISKGLIQKVEAGKVIWTKP